jgi:hypothetical protein
MCRLLGFYSEYPKLSRGNAMPQPLNETVDVRKLARAYVALALARDEAKRYVWKHSAEAGLLPLLTSLDITSDLLEDVLEKALPEKDLLPAPAITCANMLM